MKKLVSVSCLLSLVLLTALAAAAFEPPVVRTDADRNATLLRVELKRIGTLRPKSVAEVGASAFTIDAAPIDRDFCDFEKYKAYLLPLGVAKIRLMTGWAKSEKTPGRIDVAWLDRIVDWCRANGIEPLLELSYGNPAYPGAGGAGLADGLPSSEEGLRAWDRWVDFLGGHFRGRVREWAMWNEPDIGGNTPEAIADNNVRSAKILLKHIPDAKLHALSLASGDPELFENCLKAMGDDVKLFYSFVYHGYAHVPETSYAAVDEKRAILDRYAPEAVLRQGENGCPSEFLDRFALSGWPWTETIQAKWDMRRALGDLGHDVESGLFCFVDINYAPPTYPVAFSNRKGYLRTNESNDVIRVKRAYYAMQNVVSVFNGRVTRVKEPGFSCSDRTLAAYEYRAANGSPIYVFWQRGNLRFKREKAETIVGEVGRFAKDYRITERFVEGGEPSDTMETRTMICEWKGRPLVDPVWVDLMTGWVFALPAERQIVHSCGITFVEIPCYDSPCFLTERAALDIDERTTQDMPEHTAQDMPEHTALDMDER